ncbi:XdhC family protein [Halalkalibacter akibai]|uniref:XdhC protein n=1 Tax=Halalkalibacter akibai (strain ATCC 43226 / DSM 21942 / CIP 109018 / JCM 9157 / 1139) TaxID=1236973 RepID=W4QY76_HALA3|nr:XdhC family protein [Halalkalibacter akibai]GAE37036.1 XdhC protein [Halalkalibacter akibai JCM 9157]
MREFYRYLKRLKNDPEHHGAMATIIKVQGSSYRHEGAKMLFLKDGSQHGLISGGCLEEDLKYHADEVMVKQISKTVHYDLRSENDLDWGQGAGCNGKITVLLEPIKWEETFSSVLKVLEAGEEVISVCKRDEGHQCARFYYTLSGVSIGAGLFNPPRIKQIIKEFVQNGKTIANFYLEEHKTSILLELHKSKEDLIIFGAGPDVEPIVRRAAEFDFNPIVIDPRESRCQPLYFPDASKLICEHPESVLMKKTIDLSGYVLIMTHHFMKDQTLLEYFVQNKPQYLGVLGPKRRTARLLSTDQVPSWIHSPIGMDIQAEGSDEISISILAQLILVRNQKRAKEWGKDFKTTAV